MTKNFLVYGMLALLASMSSCSNDVGGETEDPNVDLKPIPQVLTRVEQTDFSRVSNAFANKLFNVLASQLSVEGKNVCVAPMSMQYALSIVANGATDDVQQQIVQAMGFEDLSYLNAQNRALLDNLTEDDEYVKVSQINGMWLDNNWADVLPEYKSVVEKYYDATVNLVDFNTDRAAIQQDINAWAKEKTNNFVTQVPVDLVRDDRMVAVNVCNFNGKWAKPFYPESTFDEVFTNYDGTTSNVKMMSSTKKYNGYYDGDMEMAELPYGQGYYTMMLVMPYKSEQLDSLMENADWWGWHEKMNCQWGEVRLPRFSISSDWTNVKRLLPALGVPEFMLLDKIVSQKIELTKLVQSVVLKVDENGTTASTVSASDNGICIENISGSMRLNKPFIFAIRENTTGAILFMGKVVKL